MGALQPQSGLPGTMCRTVGTRLTARKDAADRALVLFNNCHRGQAAVNAERMRELVKEETRPFRLIEPFGAREKQGLLF